VYRAPSHGRTDGAAPLSSGGGFVIWLIVAVVALNGIALFFALAALREVSDRDYGRMETKSRDLALGVAQSADNLIDKIDISLRTVAYDIERHADGDTRDLESVRDVVERQFQLISESEGLSIVDVEGNLVLHGGDRIPAPFSVADRDYFLDLKAGHVGLHVGKPLISRLSGAPILIFARSLRKPNGDFAGLVVIPAPLENFQRIVSGYALGPGGSLSLNASDLSPIVGRSGIVGERSVAALPRGLSDAANGDEMPVVFSDSTPGDGVKRIFALRRLSTAPIFAVAGIAEDDYLADWRVLRLFGGISFGIFLILTVSVARILYLYWKRQRRDAFELHENNVKLQGLLREVSELDTALLAACEIGGLATYHLDLVTGVWTRSPEQEAILGIDPDFPHTIAAWHSLVHGEDLPKLEDYLRTIARTRNEVFDFEYRVIRPSDNAVRWTHGVGRLEFDERGVPSRTVGAVKDVTEERERRDRIEFLAYHDVLTNLPNRMFFIERLREATERARREGEILAVCHIDLGAFKTINDAWGHEVGDHLLIEVARRLRDRSRAGDVAAYLGGDEFVLLCRGIKDAVEAEREAERVLSDLRGTHVVDGETVVLSVSVGVAVFPLDDVDEPEALIRHADLAMHEVKRNGGNGVQRFDPAGERLRLGRRSRVARVAAALENGEFRLHYQPKVEMRSGRVTGVEALIRWRHPDEGLLPPARFLPDVENTDLTEPLDDWVVREVLRQKREWRSRGTDIPVCINIFGHHLQRPDFVERFVKILAEYPDVPPDGIDIEILETTAVRDLDAVSRVIRECAKLGVDFSLDDFGTCYSSLTYFRRLPVSFLKIDRSFVANILTDVEDQALVRSIVGMAHALNRKVIAEGVETIEHGVALMRYGCDYAQGYGIARPMPADEIIPWVSEWRMPEKWASECSIAARERP